MTLHLIVASEFAAEYRNCITAMIEKDPNLRITSHTEEPYWKDPSMQEISIRIDVKSAMIKAEWIAFFDRYVKHTDLNEDENFLEIAHYSNAEDRSDPFVIAYIPRASVAV